MAEGPKKKKPLLQRLKNKYRLIIYNDDTFEEIWYMRLSRLNVLAVFGTGAIILIALVSLLIAYTPIREFIPGYPEGDMRRTMVQNYARLDSLEKELQLRGQYIDNIATIMAGGVPEDQGLSQDTAIKDASVQFEKSESDSILRKQIEQEEKYTLSVNYEEPSGRDLSQIHFFSPVKGLITNSYNARENHFGTDIVAGDNNVVVSALEGTVTMANWTLKTGWVIQIQHENNLLTVYKHNAELLKEVGDHVDAGEAVAIIGNSGELTTGPHLHFELWRNGSPLDPEKYIVF
ncbi:MAG: M23 family metallopeptidase [Bacteroidales bacterium]|nr:M23 family metallopeptidase [Bacteroidales bacterium]